MRNSLAVREPTAPQDWLVTEATRTPSDDNRQSVKGFSACRLERVCLWIDPSDRAYSSRTIRNHPRRRGIRAVIPQPSDQVGHCLRRGRFGDRPPPRVDTQAYKQRNTVERCTNRLKQWRGLTTRTDKLAIASQAALHLAGILIWSRR
ncbi:hypothetical protein BZZ08_00464 [Streptomyces sp. MH60]|nr:hypothetical protein BZZ08_00464 [Streptomyces sp. MH60]